MKDLMQAVSIREPRGPDVLEPVSRPLPELRENEVLIRVRAAGVNRPDVLQRTEKYPVPADADPLPGLEVAGRIAAVGAAVEGWRAGDRVQSAIVTCRLRGLFDAKINCQQRTLVTIDP